MTEETTGPHIYFQYQKQEENDHLLSCIEAKKINQETVRPLEKRSTRSGSFEKLIFS